MALNKEQILTLTCLKEVGCSAAGIESVAFLRGTKEKADLIKSGYCHAILAPREILTLIR